MRYLDKDYFDCLHCKIKHVTYRKIIFDWRQIPLVSREELNQIAEKIKKTGGLLKNLLPKKNLKLFFLLPLFGEVGGIGIQKEFCLQSSLTKLIWFFGKNCRYYEVIVCLLKLSDNNQFWSTKLKPITSVKVLTYFIPNKITGFEFTIELVTMKTFASNSVLLVK